MLASLVGANVVLLLPLMKSFLKRTRTKAGAAAGPSTAASGKLPGESSLQAEQV